MLIFTCPHCLGPVADKKAYKKRQSAFSDYFVKLVYNLLLFKYN